jgi:hypothetical protein
VRRGLAVLGAADVERGGVALAAPQPGGCPLGPSGLSYFRRVHSSTL